MFFPLIISPKAHLELVNNFAMPLPIPKPQDVKSFYLQYCMSFKERGSDATLFYRALTFVVKPQAGQ
jgi:hypothetical protein